MFRCGSWTQLSVACIQIGQFFGEVDPVVMISLVNTSLYSFNKTYDYQSVCNPERDCKAAAGPRSVYVVRHTHTERTHSTHPHECINAWSCFGYLSCYMYCMCIFCPYIMKCALSALLLSPLQPTIADMLSISWWASTGAWWVNWLDTLTTVICCLDQA